MKMKAEDLKLRGETEMKGKRKNKETSSFTKERWKVSTILTRMNASHSLCTSKTATEEKFGELENPRTKNMARKKTFAVAHSRPGEYRHRGQTGWEMQKKGTGTQTFWQNFSKLTGNNKPPVQEG